ncbi:MAG: phage tail tape measure protein, partial [Turicibacter sp.]|nr:phage tail tape measure protein [Turicibacter sp.]
MARADGEVRIDVNVDDTKARGSAKNLKGIFGTMGRGIVVALAAVGTAMVGIGVAAVRAGDVANASLGAIRAQTGMTEEDTRQLDRAIRDLALSQGRFSAQQMREALVDISVHGQTAAEQTLILESAMRLADATGSDLGGMAYALGATLLKFGQDASYAEMWANKFATAQRFTAVETQSLLYAMGVAAPTMNSLGLAAQQGGSGYARLAATMAVAQQEMMSHTGAARGFEEIMGTLNSTILGGSERFAELGVAVRNYDGTARDHFDVLDDLVGAFGGLDAQQQYALENYLNLGVYGAALLDIMRRQGGAISDLSVEMGNFNNIAEMGQERTGGFAEAFGTARAMGQEFLYMINEVIGARIYEWVTNAASGMKVFMAELRESGVIERFAEGIFSVVESLFRVAEALAPVVMEWLPKLAEALAIGAEWLGENSELAMGLGIAVVGLWAAFKGYAIIKSVIGMLGGLKTGIVALKGKKAIGGMAPAMSKAVGAKGGGKGM